ncbi:MAG: hypothetical protein JW864_05995 [Spirochaetes bacterium]|nr:hypothetical protein [Spirochaetota bacterium]
MPLLLSKLREISVFIYTLILLLIFNLYFNFNYAWDGISLIVRIYLLVFSFYLVFIFASIDIRQHINEYFVKYGSKGNIILFIETRIIPFLIIFFITILFTLIDYIRETDWPWNPILSLLNGRYSNNIIYSWLLLMIIRLRKKPSITIPIFLGIMMIYGMLDKMYYSAFESGPAISGIKIVKFIIFFSFLFTEFYSTLKSILISIIISIFFYMSIFASYSMILHFTESPSNVNNEAGLIILRMGYNYPAERLKKVILKTHNYNLLKELLTLLKNNNSSINFSEKNWEDLLLSGSVEMADLISKEIIDKKFGLSYAKMIDFAEKKAGGEPGKLANAEYFTRLFAKYYADNEEDFLKRLKNSGQSFKIWSLMVLKENKSINSIPLLLYYLTDIDETISDNAYKALKAITDMDPASALEKKKNDPDIIGIFNKYYIKHTGI